MRHFFHKYESVWIGVFLILSILLVYGRVQTHDFVNFDDRRYVADNPHVSDGLTVDGVAWAFTSRYAANWHPLTWLSHMLDCQLYGINPGYHHVTNLILHMASSLLLFFILKAMTGALWRSAFVAALFALHPLHVESVAWVAERKDVLSAFFWMLTIWAYARWVRHRSVKRYAGVLLLFTAGLLAKPMVVTLPFVLLLLDYWPLGRFVQDGQTGGGVRGGRVVLGLAVEKIPLFILAAASCAVTVWAQAQGGAIVGLTVVPLAFRFANALTAYIGYLVKTVWPVKLAVLYPLPVLYAIPWGKAAGAVLFLAVVTFFAIRWIRRRPYFAVGWFWYVGTLVPVIGLVQVGSQSMADRYTYIPLIGIFIMAAWGLPELVARRRRKKQWLAVSAAVALVILTALSWKQVGYWKNTSTLYGHALDVTSDNYFIHHYLSKAMEHKGRYEEAVAYDLEALRICPYDTSTRYHLAGVLIKLGRYEEAIVQYRKTLRYKPDLATAYNGIGIALDKLGRTGEAMAHYREALRIEPEFAKAHNNLGNDLIKAGRIDEAVPHFNEAVALDPDYAIAHFNLGAALKNKGLLVEASTQLSEALRIEPDFADAHLELGNLLVDQGRFQKAVTHYRQALRIEPDDTEALFNLAGALNGLGRTSEAIDHYLAVIQIEPGNARAQNNLAIAYVRSGDLGEAVKHFREALKINPAYRKASDNLNRVLMLLKQREKTPGAQAAQ